MSLGSPSQCMWANNLSVDMSIRELKSTQSREPSTIRMKLAIVVSAWYKIGYVTAVSPKRALQVTKGQF
jgi:hypothetical protein